MSLHEAIGDTTVTSVYDRPAVRLPGGGRAPEVRETPPPAAEGLRVAGGLHRRTVEAHRA